MKNCGHMFREKLPFSDMWEELHKVAILKRKVREPNAALARILIPRRGQWHGQHSQLRSPRCGRPVRLRALAVVTFICAVCEWCLTAGSRSRLKLDL